jgi:NAD(P)-dependent dehydrogenase (short-subunit alcohol dehydrogenase family)
MKKALTGKVAIITGANQGLGLQIAKAYILAGANLMICARNDDLLQKAVKELDALLIPGQKVCAQACDISKESDIRSLVKKTRDTFGKVDILVNNAGIYGPKGDIEDTSWEEWIQAIQINLFGSVLMCREIIPHFKNQGFGKVIQLSGGGATNPMPKISAYAVSKAAIVRFADTLAEEVREYGIDVNCIAPGALNTRMLDEILQAGPKKVGQDFYDRSVRQKSSGGVSMNSGSELAVFLASDASNGISGKLISATWDKWQDWPNHLDVLAKSDAYTLRRIVGRDRGLDWGDV